MQILYFLLPSSETTFNYITLGSLKRLVLRRLTSYIRHQSYFCVNENNFSPPLLLQQIIYSTCIRKMGGINVFFNSSWGRRTINFESSESGLYSACTWKLTKKILESPHQLEEWELEEDNIPSESEALFECVNLENEEDKAFMLVYMQ